jgi:hypothetical protein
MARWRGFVLTTSFIALPMMSGDALSESLDLLPLRGKHSVRVETRDGKHFSGEPIGILADTLLLKHDRKTLRISANDVVRGWEKRRDRLGATARFAAMGIVGGGILSAVQNDCPGCQGHTGEVLKDALVEGAWMAGQGLLFELIDGYWSPLFPDVTPADRSASRTQRWGFSLHGQGARLFQPERTGTFSGGVLGGWENDLAADSWGVEYGVLALGSRVYEGPGPYGDPFVGVEHDRWSYAGTQLRWRSTQPGVRPSATFGLGSYSHRRTLVGETTDVNGTSHADYLLADDRRFGFNAGVGVTWGRVGFHPAAEARFHCTVPDRLRALTLSGGVDFQ